MKRIISLILVVLFLQSGFIFNVSADAKDNYQNQYEFLSSVGVVNDYYSKGTILTKGQFINMIMSLCTDNEFSGKEIDLNAMNFALANGVIKDEKKIDFNEEINCNEALIMTVKAIGYLNLQTDAQYVQKALSLRLLKDVVKRNDNKLTSENAVQILMNATECSPVELATLGSKVNVTYEVSQKTTLLEYAKNIYIVEGIVTANEFSTLYVPEGVGKGRIKIDEVVYKCENPSYNEYLGYEVRCYIKKGKKDILDVVKYIDASGNNITVINADKFVDISDDFRTITYDKTKNKTGVINISASPNVIYNGKVYYNYTVEDFNIESGNIKVLKTMGRNNSDLVVITSYQNVIVDRVSSENETIYNKFKYEKVYLNKLDEITLKETDYQIVKSGENITINDLKPWDVLSVAISKSGSTPCINILVSDYIDETITELFSHDGKKVTAVGYLYNISNAYFENTNDKNAQKIVGERLELGKKQVYYLDVFENVVAVKTQEPNNDKKYVYITDINKKEAPGDIVTVRIFDVEESIWKNVDFSKKIKINFTPIKSSDDVYKSKYLFNAKNEPIKQLAKIKYNLNGQVISLETAQEVSQANKTIFTKKKLETTTYWTENDSFKTEIFPSENAKILVVPKTSDNEDDFYVITRENIAYDASYGRVDEGEIFAYDIDSFFRSDMIVINYDDTISPTESQAVNNTEALFVVTKVSRAVAPDGDEKTKLTGTMGEFEDLAVFAETDDVVKGVKVGDVIQFVTNAKGNLSKVRIAFSTKTVIASEKPEDTAKKYTYSSTYKKNSKGECTVGKVNDVNFELGKNEDMLLIDTYDAVNERYDILPLKLNGSLTGITIFDAETEQARRGNLNEITPDDCIVVRLRYSVAKSIVVIKNIDW